MEKFIDTTFDIGKKPIDVKINLSFEDLS